MPQLWQGRSSKAVDSRVNDFNSSIRFDARMIEQDIQGSIVHSEMLGRQAAVLLIQQIENPRITLPEQQVVSGSLQPGASTAALRR